MTTRLAQARIRDRAVVRHVGGDRAFRRRLMELGLVPGTVVELMSVAPLGDPIELLVRGASLSIRWREADAIEVELLATRPLPSAAPAVAEPHAA